jgi:hypothetical protein
MLKLPVFVGVAVLVQLVTTVTWAVPSDGVVCLPGGGSCLVVAEKAGQAETVSEDLPSSRPDSSPEVCRAPVTGEVVACRDDAYGRWNPTNGCYYRLVDPQPPPSAAVWQGNTDGAIYQMTCVGQPGTGGGWVWLSNPPPGFGGGVTAAQLAARAVEQLPIRGPEIGMAPAPGTTGLVGLPVWIWTAVTPQTWGPVSATASVPGLSVTAVARAAGVVWDMGDGIRVTCTGPGTPYTRAVGESESPTCGYRYSRPSSAQPDAAYTVTATTTWEIRWSGGGQSGQLTQTRSSTTRARIGELQVLVS